MDQFKFVFNKTEINRVLFFKVLTVNEFPNLETFKTVKIDLYNSWHKQAENRYDFVDQDVFMDKACYMGELTNIVAIAYGTLQRDEEGQIKRTLNVIHSPDEVANIEEFFGLINTMQQQVPNPLYCGHNIVNYDIPFLIKRALSNNIKVPELFKKSLSLKPWEANILDTVDLWKFNGNDYCSLKYIASFLDSIKYKTLPLDINEINRKYWTDGDGSWVEYEIKNQVNLTMQLYLTLSNM